MEVESKKKNRLTVRSSVVHAGTKSVGKYVL